MKPLRIVHVLSSDAARGGAEQIVGGLARHSAGMGCPTLVLRPFGRQETNGSVADLCHPAMVASSGHRQKSPFAAAAVRRWTGRRIAEFEPDIVHAHLTHASAIVASLKGTGPSRVLTHHHGDVLVRQSRRVAAVVDRWAARRYDRVVAVSEFVGRFAAAQGVPATRLVTIRNGWEGTPQKASGHDTVITVGNLRWEKDHGTLLRSVPLVLADVPTARFRIVGEGPLRPALEELIRELGIGHAVELVGTTDDVWPHFAGASVYVHTSIVEPLGIAVMEAMAASLPVVTTTVGGLPEIVTSETGVLIPPGDRGALAAQLVRLLRSPEVRAQLGEGGRARVSTWTTRLMCDRYMELYEELRRTSGR